MKTTSIAALVGAVLVSSVSIAAHAAAVNVALGKPVVGYGTYGAPGTAYTNAGWAIPAPPVAPFSTLTDGNFVADRQQWNIGTVWWDETYGDNASTAIIDIDLQGDYWIEKLIVQADDNDRYIINLANDFVVWPQGVVIVPPVYDWGMKTREIVLPAPVLADHVRFGWIAGTGAGDALLGVSEIQAFGTPVPEPGTLALLGLGLAGLVTARRRTQ